VAVSRTGSGPFPILEDSLGSIVDLITISTKNKNRKDVITTIRMNLKKWMNNHHFESIRESELDIAIVASVSPGMVILSISSNILIAPIVTSEEIENGTYFPYPRLNRPLRP